MLNRVHLKKKTKKDWAQWLPPIILVVWEAEVRGLLEVWSLRLQKTMITLLNSSLGDRAKLFHQEKNNKQKVTRRRKRRVTVRGDQFWLSLLISVFSSYHSTPILSLEDFDIYIIFWEKHPSKFVFDMKSQESLYDMKVGTLYHIFCIIKKKNSSIGCLKYTWKIEWIKNDMFNYFRYSVCWGQVDWTL